MTVQKNLVPLGRMQHMSLVFFVVGNLSRHTKGTVGAQMSTTKLLKQFSLLFSTENQLGIIRDIIEDNQNYLNEVGKDLRAVILHQKYFKITTRDQNL